MAWKSRTRSLQVFDTELSADTVEWCPISQWHNILACGTYQLQKGPDAGAEDAATRIGRLYLFKFRQQGPMCPPLSELQRIDTPAILDLKWCHVPVSERPLLGMATASGELQLHRLIDRENSLTAVSQWKAHDFEAWISAFSYWDTQLVYSGGDDCKLKGWDLRMGPSSPTFTSKRHSMGVCSVHSSPHRERILATGSESALGGGVWRLKWHPTHEHLLLAACMHNDFHILHCQQALASYILHNSLAYGADWSQVSLEEPPPCSPLETTEPRQSHTESHTGGHLRIQYESPTASFDTSLEDDAGRYIPESLSPPSASSVAGPPPCPNPAEDSPAVSCLMASCSFYDHMLHVWRWDWTPQEVACTGTAQGEGERRAVGEGDGGQAGAPAKDAKCTTHRD
ncbi:unnamed protein product [Coregonus sp. 'balchen']|nr:unnamed protein product [Coregonus sp. 'balchen']